MGQKGVKSCTGNGEVIHYYSFQAGTYKFIALDSSIRMEKYGHVEKAQPDWLVEVSLKTSKEKILFLHHPVAKATAGAGNRG